MVAKVESISGIKNGWGFEYRLPSSKAVTSLCHPLGLETRKDGLRYSTVMFISSGFLKTPRAFSSLHLFCRICNFSVEYGGMRPFLCGGCVGPMLIFTSNSLALPLSILNWGLNRESWSGLTFTVSEWRTVLCSKVAEAGKELDTVSLVLFDTGIAGRTWQKCSFLLSCLDSFVLFTMRVFPDLPWQFLVYVTWILHTVIQHGVQQPLYPLLGCVLARQAQGVIQAMLW